MKLKVLTGYNRFISSILFLGQDEFFERAAFVRRFECRSDLDFSESAKTILHTPVKLEFK
jgi:hypothetical protein